LLHRFLLQAGASAREFGDCCWNFRFCIAVERFGFAESRLACGLAFFSVVAAICCTFFTQPVNSLACTTARKRTEMLLVRDFVAHMANEVVKRLVEGGQIETKAPQAVANRIRLRMLEELTVEDRLNEEVRQILIERQDEMRSTGVSYQEMYKKVKQHLARDRKLVLR
jgi:hypothetical protein